MTERRDIEVDVPVLARVEGEGGLHLAVRDGRIESMQLRIFEAPRFFEQLLVGRAWHEVPDIVARICGICPVAYQMSAVHAIESIFGVDPGPWVRAMRRVLYCGEWMQSHSLHIHLLALPDFLGYDNAIAMARDYPDEVRRGLRLQSLGQALIELLGGRAVHPVGVRVGGFHRVPPVEDVARVRERLEAALGEAETLVRWVGALGVPAESQTFTSVALCHPDEYPFNEGRIVSSAGLDIDAGAFETRFAESQRPHSTALHCLLDDAPYLVGPLARVNLNHGQLPGPTRRLLAEGCGHWPSRNPFHAALARAAEIHFSIHEALRLLRDYRAPAGGAVEVAPRAGVGFGATEAPRGVLWHRYELDDAGRVRAARIVPPTSQNQARIEDDLHRSLEAYGLDRDEASLRARAEAVVRNYDPCISCSTHFLKLRVDRR